MEEILSKGTVTATRHEGGFEEMSSRTEKNSSLARLARKLEGFQEFQHTTKDGWVPSQRVIRGELKRATRLEGLNG
jgi:hypothetical protein